LFLGDRPVEVFSYTQVWEQMTGHAYRYEKSYFMALLDDSQIDYQKEWDIRTLEDLAFSLICQPFLGQQRLTLIDRFPPEQAALACLENGLAQRFEVFADGLELANGYHELTSIEQNLQRFNYWHQQRDEHCLPNWPIDQKFIQALPTFPACSGVAVGLERLLMLALNKTTLEESMLFAWNQL
jgi:elongation factor P--(R)-beta-lysine ligase